MDQLRFAASELGSYIVAYIIEKVSLRPERLPRTKKMEDIMRIAAKAMIRQGRVVGLGKGWGVEANEGNTQTYLRQVRVKFGDVTLPQVMRVRNAIACCVRSNVPQNGQCVRSWKAMFSRFRMRSTFSKKPVLTYV